MANKPYTYDEGSVAPSIEKAKREVVPALPTTGQAGQLKGIIFSEEVCPHEKQGTDYNRDYGGKIAMPIAIVDGIFVTEIVSYTINLNNKENSNVGNLVIPIDAIDPETFLELGKKHVVEIYAGYVEPFEVEKFQKLNGKSRSNMDLRNQPSELPQANFGFRFCGFVDYPEWHFGDGILQLVLMDYLQLLNETTVSDTFLNRSHRYVLDKVHAKIKGWALGINIVFDTVSSLKGGGNPLDSSVGDKHFGKKKVNGKTVEDRGRTEYHYVLRDKTYLQIIKEIALNAGYAVNTCCNVIHIGIPRTHATEWTFVQKSGNTAFTDLNESDKKVNMTGFVFRKGSLMKNSQKALIIIEYTRQNPTKLVKVKGSTDKKPQVQLAQSKSVVWPPGANKQYHGAEDQFVYRTRIDGIITNNKKEAQLKNIAQFMYIRLKRASETASFTIPFANPYILPNHRVKFAGKQVEFLKKNKYRIQSISETFDEQGWEQAVEVELDIWSSGEFQSQVPTLLGVEQDAVKQEKVHGKGKLVK